MDDILEEIKDYVLIIDSSLDDDDYLDFVVGDVVDRALIYMNRTQLVDAYEDDLADEEVDEADYELPIPAELRRALATVIVGVYKTVKDNKDATTGAITSIKDNGQEVSYASELTSFVSSKSDAEVFSSVRGLMNNFRIPTIVENT